MPALFFGGGLVSASSPGEREKGLEIDGVDQSNVDEAEESLQIGSSLERNREGYLKSKSWKMC